MKPLAPLIGLIALLAGARAAAMTLASPDIAPGATIGKAHIYPRCGGENLSPALVWTGAPAAAKSLALTMIDLDAKPAGWSHWIVVGLPSGVAALPRGVKTLPAGAHAVKSNFGEAAYGGPCPPAGSGLHRYQFTIWALPTADIAIAPDAKATSVVTSLAKRAVDHASFIGVAKR